MRLSPYLTLPPADTLRDFEGVSDTLSDFKGVQNFHQSILCAAPLVP